MPYAATAFTRTARGWAGHEVDLDDVEDLDALADVLRDESQDGQLVVLFVEENDEWLGVVRLDDGEPRVFVSDVRAGETSALAALLHEPVATAERSADGGAEEESPRPTAEPVGDADVLADLGVDAGTLLRLVAEEGVLPGDVIAGLAERIGCGDELERLRHV